MVWKSKLSNIKWTSIKVDYNCVFEDQMMLFYLKANTNYIDVVYFWFSSVPNNPTTMILGITFVVISRKLSHIVKEGQFQYM